MSVLKSLLNLFSFSKKEVTKVETKNNVSLPVMKFWTYKELTEMIPYEKLFNSESVYEFDCVSSFFEVVEKDLNYPFEKSEKLREVMWDSQEDVILNELFDFNNYIVCRLEFHKKIVGFLLEEHGTRQEIFVLYNKKNYDDMLNLMRQKYLSEDSKMIAI